MTTVLRSTFALGFMLGAISCAEASGRSAMESFPTVATLPAKPIPQPAAISSPAPAALPVATAKADERAKGRRRRTRTALSDAARRADQPPPAAVAAIAPRPQVATSSSPSTFSEPGKPGDAHVLPAGQEPAAKTPSETHPDAEQAHEAASPTLATLIAKHAAAAGVPFDLARAVVRIESRGNARAAHAGALGLMQIKAGTARAAGFIGSATGLLDADTNLHYGMKVLADAYKTAGGDICRALMKYQSGHLATHMTAANRTYCIRARAIMAGA